MMFDGIKKLNCSVNRFMSEFVSLQTVVKTNCFISIVVHCTDLNYGHCGMTVLTRCAYSGVMLCVRYGSYHMVRTKIQLIAECMRLDVALVFRFSFSDNMVVTYIANTKTFAYRSTICQNVRRHIMSK